MSNDSKRSRKLPVKKFLKGESPSAICASLGQSSFWLYKWVNRLDPHDSTWCRHSSKCRVNSPHRTPLEVEEIVKIIRPNLYNRDHFCGAQAIRWEWKIWVWVPCLQSGPSIAFWSAMT
jgi:putative transposase